MTHPNFELFKLPGPLHDWTGSRLIIRSEDCPGGVAAIIGGAEEHAELLASAWDLFSALENSMKVSIALYGALRQMGGAPMPTVEAVNEASYVALRKAGRQ